MTLQSLSPVTQVILREEGDSWYCGHTSSEKVGRALNELRPLVNIGYAVIDFDGNLYGNWSHLEHAISELKDGRILVHKESGFLPNIYITTTQTQR